MSQLIFWTLLLVFLPILYGQNVQYYYYYPYQQNQRQVYYPVRTNCQNRCIPQTRYRWTYRPMTMNGGRGVPYRPSNELKPIPDPKPIVPNYTQKTTSLPIYITTPSTTTTTQSTTTTDLPTPPPYTGPFPPNVESNRNFMRQTKPEFATTESAKYGKINPCPNGKALVNEFDSPMTCNFVVRPNGGCPEDYWCHTGSSYATTACCPIIKWEDKCQMERSNGEGEDLIPRWYYDSASGQCKRFLYKGLKGNANNFITSVQCLEQCGGSDVRSNALVNPCSVGVPARTIDNSIITCTSKDEAVCPSGFYCQMSERVGTCCERTSRDDRCNVPLSVGDGPHQLKRFYYNNIAKKCIEFVYGGRHGNENNFADYQECKRQCMMFENPCPNTFNNERKECSANDNLCDKGEWCHFGKNMNSCCPGAVTNPCKLTLEFGVGNENLTRWYSDPSDKSFDSNCKTFQYKGAKGNQNNFLSKEACERECKTEYTNPCSSELLLSPISGKPRQCGPTSPCPNSYYCHVGLLPETTVCCAAVKNPCDLPMVEGFGSGAMTRYYFNKRDRLCRPFIYKGIGGNQNNFLTAAECLSSCPAFENPCGGNGQPLLVDHRPKICSPNQRCPGTHYCHIGLEGTANVCCPKNGDPCELPVAPGVGPGALKRFYYDQETKRCREFVYHGTGGNSNSFLSTEDCELICQVAANPCKNGDPLFDKETREAVVCGGPQECPSGFFCHIGASPATTNCCPGTKRPCELELEVGDGGMELDRWYFDAGAQMCRPFKYGGIMGNANNFLNIQDCESTCLAHHIHSYCPHGIPQLDQVTKKPVPCGILKSCQIGFVCHMSIEYKISVCCENPAKFCLESREPGNCTGSEIRYGYNSLTDTCVEYKYSGCGGTLNNFETLEKCTKICCNEFY